MLNENDWILKKLRLIIRQKGIKVENIAKGIGISSGEFSKILNGERTKYYKHLPAVVDFLKIKFHDLVSNSNLENGSNNVIDQNKADQNLMEKFIIQYEIIIESKNETIKSKEELINNLIIERNYYKNKCEKYDSSF